MRARLLITGLLLLALSGCGGNDRRPAQAVPASFTTRILENGTKLFTFALEPRGDADADGAPARRRRGGPGPDGRPARHAPGAAASHRLLADLLAQNRYCRDGYLTLQQYGLRGGYTIRGECRDAADADDRSRFPNLSLEKSP